MPPGLGAFLSTSCVPDPIFYAPSGTCTSNYFLALSATFPSLLALWHMNHVYVSKNRVSAPAVPSPSRCHVSGCLHCLCEGRRVPPLPPSFPKQWPGTTLSPQSDVLATSASPVPTTLCSFHSSTCIGSHDFSVISLNITGAHLPHYRPLPSPLTWMNALAA